MLLCICAEKAPSAARRSLSKNISRHICERRIWHSNLYRITWSACWRVFHFQILKRQTVINSEQNKKQKNNAKRNVLGVHSICRKILHSNLLQHRKNSSATISEKRGSEWLASTKCKQIKILTLRVNVWTPSIQKKNQQSRHGIHLLFVDCTSNCVHSNLSEHSAYDIVDWPNGSQTRNEHSVLHSIDLLLH